MYTVLWLFQKINSLINENYAAILQYIDSIDKVWISEVLD